MTLLHQLTIQDGGITRVFLKPTPELRRS